MLPRPVGNLFFGEARGASPCDLLQLARFDDSRYGSVLCLQKFHSCAVESFTQEPRYVSRIMMGAPV
jgi:hypothetical protein